MNIIIHKIQAFKCQLTAHHNERTPNLYPARILARTGTQVACASSYGGISFWRKPMTYSIIYFYNLTIKIQGKRDIHGLRQDQITESTRHTGLTVSRRSIHK